MGAFDGKGGVIAGVASERSIAWAIAQTLAAEGANLVLTYQGGPLDKRVPPLAEAIGAKALVVCDATKDADLDSTAEAARSALGRVDFFVHSIAWATREDLAGAYLDTTREGFRAALEVSVYSFVAFLKRLAPLMHGAPSSALTLTYFGAEKVIPRYNVMGVAKAALEASVRYLAHDLGPRGIRVNAISAGPLKTLAAAGIPGFREMLHFAEERAPLRRNIAAEEVARAASFLLSEAASAVTGEVFHVDAGYNVMGM